MPGAGQHCQPAEGQNNRQNDGAGDDLAEQEGGQDDHERRLEPGEDGPVDGGGPRQSAGVAQVGQRRLEQSEQDWEPPRLRWPVATDQEDRP